MTGLLDTNVALYLLGGRLAASISARALQLRKEHHLKLPDAIVCATAVELGVELWTNDTTIAKVSGLTCRSARLSA
jgi:predicted nucleic acid-binding protein